MSSPRQALLKWHRIIRQSLIHLPRPNLAILMPSPNQTIALVNHQTQSRRSGGRLVKRCRILIPSSHTPSEPTPQLIRISKVPEPHPALLPRPQLGLRARDRTQEFAHLRLPQRVRPQLQRRRTARVNRRPRRSLEDSCAAACSELWQDAIVIRRKSSGIYVKAVAGGGVVEVAGVKAVFPVLLAVGSSDGGKAVLAERVNLAIVGYAAVGYGG